MFAPKFNVTNKTLLSLIETEIGNKLVSIAPIQQDWEVRLKNESLIRKVYGSLRFEENGLSLEDIARIVKDEPGRDDKPNDVAMRVGVVGKEKDIQQVLNLINANKLVEQIAYLSGKFAQSDYGEREMVQLNSLLGERLVASEKLGRWRDKETAHPFTGQATLPVEIPFQIDDLFSWFKTANVSEIHQELKAGVMMYEIIRISPFAENNLLTALYYYQLVLAAEGMGFKRMWSGEEEILKNTESFRTAYMSVEKNGGDLSAWLEYLAKCTAEAAEKAKTRVLNLVGDAPIFKSDGGKVISLSERQIAVMEEMTLKNEMTIKEVRSVLPMVSDDTILRDLNDLINKKLIRKKGKTKGALYVMGKVRSFR